MERRYLAAPHNPAYRPLPEGYWSRSIPQIFDGLAAEHPEAVVLGDLDSELTFSALQRGANRLAHAILRQCGPQAGPVALLFGKQAALGIGMIGALKAGKFFAPLEPYLAVEQLRSILDDLKPQALVYDRRFAELAHALGGPRLELQTALADADLPEDSPGINPGREATLSVLYTSGSTGRPKGVPRTHAQQLERLAMHTVRQQFAFQERSVKAESPNFASGQFSMWSALAIGVRHHLYDLERAGSRDFAAWCNARAIERWGATPSTFRNVVKDFAPGRNIPTLRLLQLGGERIYKSDVELFQRHFGGDALLSMGLGTTETGSVAHLCLRATDVLEGDQVPAGYAAEGVELVIADENGLPLPPGMRGEVCMRSATRPQIYLDNPEADARKYFEDSERPGAYLYRTGDAGWLEPDGLLYLAGRIDDQLKVRGMWVNTTEVAAVLAAHPAVHDAAVRGLPDKYGNMRLAAYVVGSGGAIDLKHLRAFLGERLARHMLPSYFIQMEALPRRISGKLDLGALPALEGQRPAVSSEFIAPRTELERSLCAIWEDVLDVRPVGVQDDFNELGGDSLQAARVFAAVEERLGRGLPPALLYTSPTVEALARKMAEDLPADEPPPFVVPVQWGERRRPFLFFITPRRGDAIAYRYIVENLPPDQTIYSFNSWVFPQEVLLQTTIPELAARYVARLVEIEPEGPYVLGGHSLAGIIAYEMALQLRQRGGDVALVFMFDTYGPGFEAERIFHHQRGRMLRQLFRLRGREQLRFALDLARQIPVKAERLARQTARRFNLELPLTRRQRENKFYKGVYHPPASDLPVLLFKASQDMAPRNPDKSMGWNSVVQGGVRIETVEGEHASILKGHGAEQIAAVLRRELAALGAGPAEIPAGTMAALAQPSEISP
jgi:acyl-coenzyme A synthetase/AMP-(fatty) acid ligase/thioesterase domain-containing protein/acyl carrier protein